MSADKICSSCGVHNGAQAKFCANCGAALAPKSKVCVSCGMVNEFAARFCIECGAPFSAGPVSSDAVLTPKPEAEPITPPPPVTAAPPPQTSSPSAAPSGKTPRQELSDHKMAAIAIWILCLIGIFIALLKGQASHDQVMACIAAGGSGKGCASGPFWAKVVWVLAVIGSGVGARLWSRK